MDEPIQVTPEDWQATPPAVQARVEVLEAESEALRAENEALKAENEALQAEVQTLRAENEALREHVGQNSTNSSRPPSTDPPGTPKPQRTPSGRRPGGQPGHEGVSRTLKPMEEVKEVIPVKPEKCHRCGHPLEGEDANPQRHQVTEIPPLVSETTEYQLHTLECPQCWERTCAELPEGVPAGAFGPRVQAMVAALSGQYHLSKRQIEELLGDFFGVEMGLGSVKALEEATSEVLKKPVEEAQETVKKQPVANVDETGWREGPQKGWLWVAVTGSVTVFLIRLSRGAKVAKELLGEAFGGIVGSDRWSGYNWVDNERRQVCWAHLLREFAGWVARGGESQRIGQELLDQAELLFHWWHRVRDGTMSRAEFQQKMQEVQARVGKLLREGATCDHAKKAGTCRKILEVEESLWTFVRVEGVEPTNNAAERAVRPGVLWRKGSFGTQTAAGSRFVERMMTVVATRKQQRRNVLEYLTAVCAEARRGEKVPSLLPTP